MSLARPATRARLHRRPPSAIAAFSCGVAIALVSLGVAAEAEAADAAGTQERAEAAGGAAGAKQAEVLGAGSGAKQNEATDAAAQVRGGETGAKSEAPVSLDEVEVVGERPSPARAIPSPDEEPTGFGTTIDKRSFAGERLGVAELLLNSPGTRIQRTPGGATLSLRGTSSEHALVFLDGIRLNVSAGGGLDLRTIPPGLLDRITVLRGNEGARYGTGALGGVALLYTRPSADGHTEAAVSLSGGSFGSYDLDASVTGGSTRLYGLAAIALQRSDGDYFVRFDPTPSSDPSDVRRERLANNDQQGGGLLLKGTALVSSARIDAMAQGSLGERGLPGTLYWRDTQRRGERRLLASLRASPAEASEHSVYGGLELRHDEVAVWAGSSLGIIGQPATAEDERPWQIENALDASLGAELAPARWTLVRIEGRAGGEWLDGPYHGSPSRERLALSVMDELYLGRMLTLAPALRFDRIGGYEGLSPKLGLSLRPLDGLELRANVGRSFRVPSFGELYLVQGPVRPNPDLRPERGYTVDGGVVLRGASYLVQLSAFYTRTSDLIAYEIVSGGLSKPFNFLDAEIVGGEAETAVTPLSWLTLSAGYGLARTANLRDDQRFLGKELPYRPVHRLTMRAAARRDWAEGFVEGSHQSSQFVNRSNSASLPSQTSARTGAGARLWQSNYDVWLSAQLENAFDAELIDQLGFPQPGRAIFLTLRILPAASSSATR